MSNMYDFIGNNTWNPLAGTCQHMCHYCYRNKMMFRPAIKVKYSGPPRLDEKAMKKNLGSGKYWFVCSMTDLFADSVPESVIDEILGHCELYLNNDYLFQSKNPYKMYKYKSVFPINSVLATTIETNRIYPEMGNTMRPIDRMMNLSLTIRPTMLTIEPIMDFDLDEFLHMIEFTTNLQQVNIGANTNHKVKLSEPEPEKIRELIKELEKFTTVKLKSNLKRLLPEVK